MPYLSGISWGESFIVSFVDVYKRRDLIDIGGRGLLMRMFTIIKICFLAFTHTSLSSMIFFHSRNVVKGVTTEENRQKGLLKLLIGKSVRFTERPLKFGGWSIDRRAKYLSGIYAREKLRWTAHQVKKCKQ